MKFLFGFFVILFLRLSKQEELVSLQLGDFHFDFENGKYSTHEPFETCFIDVYNYRYDKTGPFLFNIFIKRTLENEYQSLFFKRENGKLVNFAPSHLSSPQTDNTGTYYSTKEPVVLESKNLSDIRNGIKKIGGNKLSSSGKINWDTISTTLLLKTACGTYSTYSSGYEALLPVKDGNDTFCCCFSKAVLFTGYRFQMKKYEEVKPASNSQSTCKK
ncbi:hypothetical protein BdWA1_002869 [Babesia duncani]|uniref:Uncharacterized protein n=1 Tax=Babesia duncani TaxID=323732 RepID=A0AAD9PHY9_9APIC|nr:hypothetical protein BdWA1_002869 [Babesia duncani]